MFLIAGLFAFFVWLPVEYNTVWSELLFQCYNVCIALAIIEVGHQTGTFEGRRNLFNLKKVLITSVVILAILDWIIDSFVVESDWAHFFFSTIPWAMIQITIIITLLQGINQTADWPHRAKSIGKCGTILYATGIIYLILTEFFV